MPFTVAVISPEVNSFSSKSVLWVNLGLAQECYLPCVWSPKHSFFLYTLKFISPEHLKCPKPSNEAEQLADSTPAAEEARAWVTSSKWYAWLGSEEADPSSTSNIGPCESHPGTSHGVSPGCFLQHGLWRACTPKLTPPVTALLAPTYPCATCVWESALGLELAPEPLFSSSLCRPSSLFLFLFCCRSNSSWTFSVLPERYLPPFSCVALSPHPGF